MTPIFSFLLLLLFLSILPIQPQYTAPLYPQWAHHHVVWINGWQQDEQKFLTMLDNYQKCNHLKDKDQIKVGGALIDANWETEQNNFLWNNKKWPNPEALVKKLHAKGIRLFLWVTSMFDKEAKIYQQAKNNGYLLNHGKIAKFHSGGAFLDYLNPKAIQWWHRLMDKVLDIGVDGFKCDGTDPIAFMLQPLPYSPYAKRYLYKHQYGHLYYGDFYNYTKQKTQYALIMARPTDTFQTYTSWNYAPKYVMFAGWVGDQDSSSNGLKKAMYNILKSAWNGYLNFGFDIGGYRGQNITKNVFIRWVQVGALVPFMENGGNGKHQPWLFDQQTVDIYRKFVDLHYQLKPTFLTCAIQKYQQKKSVIAPLAKKIGQDTIKLPTTYCYLLCDNLLVAPIFQQNGLAEVVFPPGSNWLYYFDTKKIYPGGHTAYFTFKLNQTALFLKTNSVIILQDQILVVAINNNYRINKTIIYGSYSDQFTLSYDGQTISMEIKRYYRYTQVMEMEKMFVDVKLIGFENDIDDQMGDDQQTKIYKLMVNDGIKTIENVHVLEKYTNNIDNELTY